MVAKLVNPGDEVLNHSGIGFVVDALLCVLHPHGIFMFIERNLFESI